MRDYIPESASEGLIVAGILVAALFTSAYAKFPPMLFVLALFGVIVASVAQRPNLVAVTLVPLIVYMLQCVDIRVVLRRFAVATVLLFACVVLAYFIFNFNAANDLHHWREYSRAFQDRSSLGFAHPNRAMPAWAVVVIAILALARRRLLWLVVLAPLTYFFYVETDSRASTLLIATFILSVVVFGRRLDRTAPGWVRALALFAPIGLTVGSFAISLLARDTTIDALLSGRPRLYAVLLDTYSPFAILGTSEVETATVDSGYLQIVLAKGILLSAIYLTTISFAVGRSRPSWRSVLILVAFLGLSLAETALLNLAFLSIVLISLEIDRRQYRAKLEPDQPRS